MRKFIVTFMASLLSCAAAAHAFWPEATDSSLEVGVGYRQDKIKWRTEVDLNDYGYGYSSYESESGDVITGIRSDLEWKNLQIWQIELNGKYVTCDNIYLKLYGDYGWITGGKNRDRDFLNGNFLNGSGNYNDDYSFENNRSDSHAKGHVYDVKIAVGYQFKLCDDSFSLAPVLGYSWHGQHLKDNRTSGYGYDCGCEDDGDIALADLQRAHGSSYSDSYSDYYSDYSDYGYSYSSGGGNHAVYSARWNGPFIGFDFEYRLGCGCEWLLFGGYEFHWARYHAHADRNWRSCSGGSSGFRHNAKNAYGNFFDIGVQWDFCDCWTASVKGQFQWWWAEHGRDRLDVAHCSAGDLRVEQCVSIPLRHVKWDSASISLNLGMVF